MAKQKVEYHEKFIASKLEFRRFIAALLYRSLNKNDNDRNAMRYYFRKFESAWLKYPRSTAQN